MDNDFEIMAILAILMLIPFIPSFLLTCIVSLFVVELNGINFWGFLFSLYFVIIFVLSLRRG